VNEVLSKFQVLKKVYRSWKYDILNIIIVIAYYYLFQYLVLISTRGIVIQTTPAYLIYFLDGSASVLITLSIYSVAQRLSNRKRIVTGASSGAVSAGSILAAGISAGCACQAPVLYNLLYFFGLNAFEASSFVAIVDQYQIEIMWVLLLINIGIIFLTLSRMQASLR
jgi:hypothetical protein